MKAVVMAGGEGSRLRPITANRPKPLTPVCNRPIMGHILQHLAKHGITDVVATLHYLADEVQSAFGDGSDDGVNLTYSLEPQPLGTAGSVKNAEEFLKDGAFLIVSGDALTDCDLSKAIAYHKEKGAIATLILHRVPNPLDFGVVITKEDGSIERFLEKPSWSEVFSDTVNTGMYILEPEIFDLMEPGVSYDWSGDIFPKLLEQGKPIYGYVMQEYWADVGSLTQYREAQEHLLSGRVGLPIPGIKTGAGVHMGANCQIDPLAQIVPPVCLGRNVKIKRNARVGPYTVIGDNGFVEEEAVVERSVVWESAYIGPNVGIHSAIVCARTTIKRDSTISEDAVVGDRCLIDVNCTIRPRIKLWPDKIIERGSTVTMSLVWGNKWRGNLYRELGVAGLSNIEITPDFACRLGSAYGTILPRRSKVVVSRDSTRSSRMIKRAFMSGLLSVGCDVIDLRSIAAPVARHYIKKSGAAGAVAVRKLPGNARVTLIEMFDSTGGYLPQGMERKVETTFFREDFARTDPDDLGQIENALSAVEEYQADFFKTLRLEGSRKRLRVVCDYGYSSLATFYPAMLSKLGIESISLNNYHDSKLSPRSKEDVAGHVMNLQNIVASLGYDMGVLFTDEGERITVVDDQGEHVTGYNLFAILCALISKTSPKATFAMSVVAPSRLEDALVSAGHRVIRTKADARHLMKVALEEEVDFAGDENGGFIFPELHVGFDGSYALAKLLAMLQKTGLRMSDVAAEIPNFQLAYEQVRCPWENKGSVMRRISEETREQGERVELVDGIKIFDGDGWVLVLPDAVEPMFHIYAESGAEQKSQALVEGYVRKIEQLQATTG